MVYFYEQINILKRMVTHKLNDFDVTNFARIKKNLVVNNINQQISHDLAFLQKLFILIIHFNAK